jgi:GxxExxY protein
MLHSEITETIIRAAKIVLAALRPGLHEKIYENALVIELRRHGLEVEQQRQFPVHYRGEPVGTLIPDLIVARKIIVDAKVVSAFNDSHVAQILGYLAITKLQVALLLNFAVTPLGVRRLISDR